MKHLTDPREFQNFDDAPTNRTGKGQEETDYDSIPYKTGWREQELDEGEGIESEDEMREGWNDAWDSFTNE